MDFSRCEMIFRVAKCRIEQMWEKYPQKEAILEVRGALSIISWAAFHLKKSQFHCSSAKNACAQVTELFWTGFEFTLP